jgi:hypothetical protein
MNERQLIIKHNAIINIRYKKYESSINFTLQYIFAFELNIIKAWISNNTKFLKIVSIHKWIYWVCILNEN